MTGFLLHGLLALQAWPGLVVILGLAFIAMGTDLALQERKRGL
jgi:hypothetical protein